MHPSPLRVFWEGWRVSLWRRGTGAHPNQSWHECFNGLSWSWSWALVAVAALWWRIMTIRTGPKGCTRGLGQWCGLKSSAHEYEQCNGV